MSLRILYAAGPGDVIGTYEYWRDGRDDPAQVAMTYSGQFYDLCRELDAQALVISTCSRRASIRDGRFTIQHRPIPLRTRSGVLYHIGQLLHELRLVGAALRFRADVVVVGGYGHWFAFLMLPMLGIHVVPTLHCVLWCKESRPGHSVASRQLLRLNRRMFARCTAIMAVSDDIASQVTEMTAGQHPPLVSFLPTYRRSTFAGVAEPDPTQLPFRVLFAGRVERNKGVFDLLEAARRFKAEGRKGIVFDICGSGSALTGLQAAAGDAGIGDTFRCHGYCNQPEMMGMLSRSHVVAVPTTTEFIEGFNKVVAESVLAGRPVVTSSVCPALSYVREAVVEVPPNDVQAYGNAILRLRDDRQLYDEKRRSSLALQEQFYDEERSWKAALRRILLAICEGREPEPVSWMRESMEVTTPAGRF